MNKQYLISLATLRILVGYLGEKDQFSWWSSSFFSSSSDAFLSPIFSKTAFLAQYNGVKEAAAKVHDEHIGVGRVYHLFRLPEHIEQQLHQLLHDKDIVDQIRSKISDKETALHNLSEYNKESVTFQEGPLKAGNIESLSNGDIIKTIAKQYCLACEKNLKVYPYFSAEK